ncbi:hypothetical protein ABVK25_011118 [Lepraria finkii]|uniref:Uncharacterized protein n=1 Tax=Lepraria finkii TaxID=1340010 RepID=A0ABR4AQL9_9LECA
MSLPVRKIRDRGMSDPKPPASPSITRTRVQTLENPLFGDAYKQHFHEVFTNDKQGPWEEIPVPDNVTSPDAMTDTLIKRAFLYAYHRVQHRKVTPRTTAFLEQYRDTAAAAMMAPSRDKKIELATLNRILHSEAFLYRQPSKEELEGQVAVKELVQFRYYADYGDYMAENCKRFRDGAIERKTEGVQNFAGSGESWTVIQKRIDVEDDMYERWCDEGRPGGAIAFPDRPTIEAIKKACTELGLNYENTRFAIRWYSRRNEVMHSKVGIYIQQCDWNALATQLWRDIRDLPNVFGDEEYRHMHKALDKIKDRYFDKLDPEKPVHNVKAMALSCARNKKDREKLARERKLAQGCNASQVSTNEKTPASATEIPEEE